MLYNLPSVYLLLFCCFILLKKKKKSNAREKKISKSLHVNNTFHHQMVAWMERVHESNFNFPLVRASPPLDTIRTRSFVSTRRCRKSVINIFGNFGKFSSCCEWLYKLRDVSLLLLSRVTYKMKKSCLYFHKYTEKSKQGVFT